MLNLPLSDATLRLSEEVATLTLGIDALYREEDPQAEGLAVVNMGSTRPRALESYAEATEALAALAPKALALEEPDRRLYYAQALTSLSAFCAFRQGKLGALSDQINLFLHVDPAPASDAEIEAYNRELYALLGSMGYAGDLRARCAAWEAKNVVPPDEVQGAMDALMAVARERTGEILPLPEGDFYRCETIRGGAFNAMSDYENRRVVINIDPILTRQSLKHLVCHECYPGHFMQFTLRRQRCERGIGGADGLLSVVNHASSSTFEGIADAGIEFIDWMEGDDDRVQMLVSTIRSALGTAASHRMHALGQSDRAVEDFLRQNAFTGGEGWVANRMAFIRNTARSALIWSYWRGDGGVFPVWRRVEADERDRFFDYIYGRLHTVESLRLF